MVNQTAQTSDVTDADNEISLDIEVVYQSYRGPAANDIRK